MTIAVIVDIVRSRGVDDRENAQRDVRGAFWHADTAAPPSRALWATVGDEFQAMYTDLGDALRATALVRLVLPEGVDCRFGIGRGEAREVERTAEGVSIQDGSAWWRAREAIDAAHRLEDRGQPWLRTWFVGGEPAESAAVNALLLQRDHTLARMKARERRIAALLLEGHPQAAIAQAEGISQSAVSQSLQRSGASALATGLDQFDRGGAA